MESIGIVIIAIGIAMQAHTTVDSFGNLHWHCNEATTRKELRFEGPHSKQCDVLIGCSRGLAHELQADFAGKNAEGKDVFVLQNKANCPLVIDGRIRSTGVLPLAVYKDQSYVVLHKDKTRNVLTFMGGSWDRSEYTRDDPVPEHIAKQTARREAKEETEGVILLGGEKIAWRGLEIKEDLTQVAEIQFNNNFFGAKEIDDRFRVFTTSVDECLFSLLFRDCNRQPDGMYRLEYDHHPETAYLAAIPYNAIVEKDSRKLLNQVLATRAIPMVSALALFVLHASENKLDETFEDRHPSFPPSFRRVQFLQQAAEDNSCAAEEKLQFLYNASQLNRFVEYATDEKEEIKMQTTIASIQKAVSNIQKKCPRNFYASMHDELRKIRAMASEWIDKHPDLRPVLDRLLLNDVTVFEQALADAEEMTSQERKTMEEDEQNLWKSQAREHSALMTNPLQSQRPARCYMSYAWTTPKHQEKEQWVQGFLGVLRQELQASGIRCLRDEEDCGPGANIVQFMQEIERSQYVFVFCTRSMMEKHKDIKYSNVQSELALISRRSSGVIPILLSGTIRSSVPEFLLRFPILDSHNRTSYAAFVQSLVTSL